MECYKTPKAGRGSYVGEYNWSNYVPRLSIYERRSAASTILSITYDHPAISSIDDPTIQEINTFSEISVEYALPGNHLVEFFPWMLYIPSSIAKWKRVAEERQKKYSAMFEAMFYDVEDRIVRV